MRWLRLPKAVRSFTILGLPITLLLGVLAVLYLFVNNKANPINQLVILSSKWRNLRKYLIAQARLESANFTSNLYRNNNNAMGMGHATKGRAASQLGTNSSIGHEGQTMQKYRNDTQSFRDMFDWYRFTRFPRSVTGPEQYVAELKKRDYFSLAESVYLNRLREWL